MRFFFVRHGESESNVSGHWQGQGDSPLSMRGREQARALGERMRAQQFSRVVSSDLSRAHDTARAIFDRPEVSPAWREVDVGRWEGVLREKVAELFPDEVRRLQQGATDVKIGGAESWDDLAARADQTFHRLVEETEDDPVLVVAHGGILSNLLAGLFGLRQRFPKPLGRISNASVTEIQLENGEAVLQRFNDSRHYAEAGQWLEERKGKGDLILTVAVISKASATTGLASESVAAQLTGPVETATPELAALPALLEREPRERTLACTADEFRTLVAEILGVPAHRIGQAGPGSNGRLVVSRKMTSLADLHLR
ncbi:MAG: histidine phosphatase family protein [Myxococcota bacterium]